MADVIPLLKTRSRSRARKPGRVRCPAQMPGATATEQAGGDATVAAGRPEPIGYCESPRHDEGRIGWGDNMGGYEE